MLLDLTKLSEDELIELNRHVVERLRLLRSTKSLAQLATFRSAWSSNSTLMTAGRSAAP